MTKRTNTKPKTDLQAAAERRRKEAEAMEVFLRETIAAIPLDFDKATDANGNPIGWEGD